MKHNQAYKVRGTCKNYFLINLVFLILFLSLSFVSAELGISDPNKPKLESTRIISGSTNITYNNITIINGSSYNVTYQKWAYNQTSAVNAQHLTSITDSDIIVKKADGGLVFYNTGSNDNDRGTLLFNVLDSLVSSGDTLYLSGNTFHIQDYKLTVPEGVNVHGVSKYTTIIRGNAVSPDTTVMEVYRNTEIKYLSIIAESNGYNTPLGTLVNSRNITIDNVLIRGSSDGIVITDNYDDISIHRTDVHSSFDTIAVLTSSSNGTINIYDSHLHAVNDTTYPSQTRGINMGAGTLNVYNTYIYSFAPDGVGIEVTGDQLTNQNNTWTVNVYSGKIYGSTYDLKNQVNDGYNGKIRVFSNVDYNTSKTSGIIDYPDRASIFQSIRGKTSCNGQVAQNMTINASGIFFDCVTASSSGMNYTNLAMVNKSNEFNGTQTIDGRVIIKNSTSVSSSSTLNILAQTDHLNPSVTGFYIFPNTGNAYVHLSHPSIQLYALDFSNITNLLNVPAFTSTSIRTANGYSKFHGTSSNHGIFAGYYGFEVRGNQNTGPTEYTTSYDSGGYDDASFMIVPGTNTDRGLIIYGRNNNNQIALDIRLNATVSTSKLNITSSGELTTASTITTQNASRWAGFGVCYATGGKLGHCTNALNASGSCTCVTN